MTVMIERYQFNLIDTQATLTLPARLLSLAACEGAVLVTQRKAWRLKQFLNAMLAMNANLDIVPNQQD